MDFSSIKRIKEQLSSLEKISDDEALIKGEFTPIDCDLFIVRLAGGAECFCKPRCGYYTNVTDYTHIQVMIQEKSRQESDLIVMIQPASDDRFKGFAWANYFHYSDFQGKINNSYIGSNVPLGEIPQLIKDIYKINKLKIFF